MVHSPSSAASPSLRSAWRLRRLPPSAATAGHARPPHPAIRRARPPPPSPTTNRFSPSCVLAGPTERDPRPMAPSRDHTAFEQLVCDRRGDLVDERGAHLRIATQQLDDSLLLGRFRFAS